MAGKASEASGSVGADSQTVGPSSPAGLSHSSPHPVHSFYAVVTALPLYMIRLLATSPCSSRTTPGLVALAEDGKEGKGRERYRIM